MSFYHQRLRYEAVIAELENGDLLVTEYRYLGLWRRMRRKKVIYRGPEGVTIVDAQSDIRDGETMPEIGQKLLPFLLPRKLREAVAGDLAEDFKTYTARWGRSYALRWFWWELALLCIRRLSPVVVFTAVAMWFRHKLGP